MHIFILCVQSFLKIKLTNVLNPVYAFNSLNFTYIHDQQIKVFGVVNIKLNCSIPNSVVAFEVYITYIYIQLFGNGSGNVVINSKLSVPEMAIFTRKE